MNNFASLSVSATVIPKEFAEKTAIEISNPRAIGPLIISRIAKVRPDNINMLADLVKPVLTKSDR